MKTFIRSLTLGALSLGLSLMASQPATAQPVEFLPVWTGVASTCSPDENTVGKYAFSLSDFYFNGSAVSNPSVIGPAPITVRCNVTNPLDVGNPKWDSLVVGFQDPDGIGTGARVQARLIRINRPSGAAAAVATFNSPSAGANVTTRRELFIQFNHAFNFLAYEYFVEINITRASTAVASPRVYSVRLANIDVVE